MQIFSANGELIAQYGEKRRIPLRFNQIPLELVHAFIAIEDGRFYEHHGIDPVGILRAISVALISGYVSQGASTVTQQLARNFFLSPERILIQKIKEVFFSCSDRKIVNKNEILELYLNKIYLGYHAYGVGAAAQVYFGKHISQLTLNEIVMIAGLPKAPSTFNPLYSPKRALTRRNTVLARMRNEKYITQDKYEKAQNMRLVAYYRALENNFSAPYIAEMVRQDMIKRYGKDTYTRSFKVYKTIFTKPLQQAAQNIVRNNILSYDIRHGYRGPSSVFLESGELPWDTQHICNRLKSIPAYGPLHVAVITETSVDYTVAMMVHGSSVSLLLAGMLWARPFKSDTKQGQIPKKVTDFLQIRQKIWVSKTDNG